MARVQCSYCDGEGYYGSVPCSECQGRGYVETPAARETFRPFARVAAAPPLREPETARGEVAPAEIQHCSGCSTAFRRGQDVFTLRLRLAGVQLCPPCVRAMLPAAREVALWEDGR